MPDTELLQIPTEVKNVVTRVLNSRMEIGSSSHNIDVRELRLIF